MHADAAMEGWPSTRPAVQGGELGESTALTQAGKSLIPEKYFSATVSGLTAEVVAGKDNEFDFNLEGDVPP